MWFVEYFGNNVGRLAVFVNTHDFNGDGKSDIAWRGPTGDLAIWLMNGTQILSGPDLGNVPTSWSIVGQRQLNNSGYADLLWRGPTGDLSIWFMNGTQILSTADFGTIPTSWSIVGTSAYNASNGYAELFWRDTTGDLAIWQINGSADPRSAGSRQCADQLDDRRHRRLQRHRQRRHSLAWPERRRGDLVHERHADRLQSGFHQRADQLDDRRHRRLQRRRQDRHSVAQQLPATYRSG